MLIILILSTFDIYQDAYPSPEFIIYKVFAYMFVLPDVPSASIAGVELAYIVFSMTDFCCELTETLKMILSYKSYFAFLWHKIYILHV